MATDVNQWLEQLGLGQYAAGFKENDVDETVLPQLTADDLIAIGVTSVGHRRKLLSAIAMLVGKQQSVDSLQTERASPRQVAEAERRQLTVMFCDLVDSTVLSTRVDPEDLRDVIASFQSCCKNVVDRYDGFIAKFMGDGILVYFGFPRAHEDSAERSARAALDIIAAIAELNLSISQPIAANLAVRIGIATGPVVVGDQIGEGTASETAVVGQTPNLAARLQHAALPNQIVISGATRAMLGEHFEVHDLGLHNLKGFEHQISLWQVVSEARSESRFAATRAGSTSPLVGRQEELGLLLRAWQETRLGYGQVIHVRGEAGIGKSRLVEALREAAGQDCTWVTLQTSHFHSGSSLYPVIEHLKRVFDWQPEDTQGQRFSKLELQLGTFKSLPHEESVPLFSNLMSIPFPENRYGLEPLSAQQRRNRTLEALAAWMLELAEARPTIMAWEDLHWADPTTLELLAILIEQVPTVPLLLVGTYRHSFSQPWPNRSHIVPITLNRLKRDEVAGITAHLLKGKSLPVQVIDHIASKSDGVPLYVEELTKAIISAGVLDEQADSYLLRGALGQLNIPETLQDTLMARLDRVPRLREIAQLGSVLGREFTYEMMRLMRKDEANLQSCLGQLVMDELLYQRGSPPRSRYLFKHTLIQEAAYRSLLKKTRQQYHLQAAKLIEDRFPELVTAHPELLAHHYSEAGAPDPAITYWYKAGVAAARKSANAEAIDQLKRGLALLGAISEVRKRAALELDLQMALGPAVYASGSYSHSDLPLIYSRAKELSEELGDQPRRFTALRGLQLHHQSSQELPKAQHFAEEALQLAYELRDMGRVVGGHMAVGSTLYFQGKLDGALRHFAMGLESCKEGMSFPDWPGAHPVVQCEFYSAIVLWMLGFPARALEKSNVAVARAEALGHPLTLAQTLGYGCALLHTFRREPSEVIKYASKSLSICEQQHISNFHSIGLCIHGWAACMLGEKEKGASSVTQGLEAYGSGIATHFMLALQAEVQLMMGNQDAAYASATNGLLAVQRSGGSAFEAELHRLRGDALAATRDTHQEAEAAFQQGLATARKQNSKSWELRNALGLARLWKRQGKAAQALEIVSPIYGWFEEGLDTPDLLAANLLIQELNASNS